MELEHPKICLREFKSALPASNCKQKKNLTSFHTYHYHNDLAYNFDAGTGHQNKIVGPERKIVISLDGPLSTGEKAPDGPERS